MKPFVDQAVEAQRAIFAIVASIEANFAKSPTSDATRDLHDAVTAVIVRHAHRCGDVSDAQLMEATDALTASMFERAVTKVA